MTHHLEIRDRIALQRILSTRVLHWAGWRDLQLWLPEVGVGPGDRMGRFLLQCPEQEGVKLSHESPEGVTVVEGGWETRKTPPIHLRDLWRRVRPFQRGSDAREQPDCHLLLVDGSPEDVLDRLLEECSGGLEYVVLKPEARKDAGTLRGFLLKGDQGRQVALSPPEGCRAHECTEVSPSGSMAVLPIGWTVGGLVDEIWPHTSNSFLLYSMSPMGHSVEVYEKDEEQSVGLVDLVEPLPSTLELVADPFKSLNPTTWRVIPRTTAVEPAGQVAEHSSVVFRIRTHDRIDHETGESAGHDLGHALLQVLDECEAGLLPSDVRYSAVAASPTERWHLLHVEDPTPELIDSWTTVDRFEEVAGAADRGLKLFVSTACRMSPSIDAMLGGDGSPEVLARIRALLGNPGSQTLVLVEAADGGETGSGARLVHVDMERTRPLSEILPVLIRDWHSAEPLRALQELAAPSRFDELRLDVTKRLAEISEKLRHEIDDAAEHALQQIEAEANRSATQINTAVEPVVGAKDLVTKLNLMMGGTPKAIGETLDSIASTCTTLAEARLGWFSGREQEGAATLHAAATRLGDARSVHQRAGEIKVQLDARVQEIAGLQREIEGHTNDVQKRSEEIGPAISHVEDVIKRIRQKAANAKAEMGRQLEKAKALLEEAMRLNDEAKDARKRVEDAEKTRDRLTQETQAMREDNDRRKEAAMTAMTALELVRLDLAKVRNNDLPDLEKKRTRLEAECRNLREGRGGGDALLEKIRVLREEVDALWSKAGGKSFWGKLWG